MVIRFDRWVRRRWFLAAAFFGSLLVVRGFWELTSPVIPVTSRPLEPLYRLATPTDAVVLTFNISWGAEVATEIVEQLAALDTRATFFVSGPWAVENVSLLKKMVAAGHDVGSLGHQVVNLTAAPVEDVKSEIVASVEAIIAAGAPNPVFFRPPGGTYNQQVLSVAHELGLTTVLWNVDARDWLSPGTDVIVSRILTSAVPGSIILLHASDHNRQTAQALPRIVEQLREKGLRPLPLSQLVSGPEKRVGDP